MCRVRSTLTAPTTRRGGIKNQIFLACARVRVRECDLVYYINLRRIFLEGDRDESILSDA